MSTKNIRILTHFGEDPDQDPVDFSNIPTDVNLHPTVLTVMFFTQLVTSLNQFLCSRTKMDYHFSAAVIRDCYPEIWEYTQLFPHCFFIPVTHLPDGAIYPDINISARNLTYLCAALRLLGWSGNLYWGVRDGETVPNWHWSTHIVSHPHGLP